MYLWYNIKHQYFSLYLALFICASLFKNFRMTVFDIENYLKKIYDVNVLAVRTRLVKGNHDTAI